jgi:hypothetical protein
MKEFFGLLDNLKNLYENELYEDVKLLADLLIGLIESSSSSLGSWSAASSAGQNNGSCSSSSSSQTEPMSPFLFDSKDKYTIYQLYGNAAFHLKEYKLAESLYTKALQVNKSNLRSKTKTHVRICVLLV